MVYATDLKSVGREAVRVRFPPPAPLQNQLIVGSEQFTANCPLLGLCIYGVPTQMDDEKALDWTMHLLEDNVRSATRRTHCSFWLQP